MDYLQIIFAETHDELETIININLINKYKNNLIIKE